MSKVVLTDTCFWLGLVDKTDQYHEASLVAADLIEGYQIIFPFPCLYETISTRMTRRREQLLHLEELISKPNIKLLDDSEYKEQALKQIFQNNRIKNNRIIGVTHSLTDAVIREILKDVNIRVNYMLTFNTKDFRDLCNQRNIELIDE